MFCGAGKATATPLEQHAKSLSGHRLESPSDALVMLFPMYTVPLQVLLDMGEIAPHEELREKGVLVEFHADLGNAAFVSHQWVGDGHPDPEFKQMRVLQDALRHVMSGLEYISLDLNTEALVPGAKCLATKTLRSKPLFVWYDYFSCPQKDLQAVRSWRSGVGRANSENSSLSRAIDSIPAYIGQSQFFFVLAPVINCTSEPKLFSPSSWAKRGWCRVERACRELSPDNSWIMIKSQTELELVASPVGAGSGGGAPGEGAFTMPEDRLKMAPILRQTLRQKLLLCLKTGDFVGYRVFLNLQAVTFRGLQWEPIEDLVPGFEKAENLKSNPASLVVARFLHQNGFMSVKDSDSRGWSTLHYAALGGDPGLIQGLLEQKADLNLQTKKDQPLVGMPPFASALAICMFFRHNKAARLLVDAKARIDGGLQPALNLAGLGNNAEGIRILCEANCNPHTAKDIFGLSALEAAAAQGSLEAMNEILVQAGGSMSSWILNRAIYSATSFRGGQTEVIQRLIQVRADVNHKYPLKAVSLHALYLGVKGMQHRFGRVTNSTRQCYHAWGATPLMAALLSAQYEGAAALIAAGARLDLRNARGCTAAELVREQVLPRFLVEALQGRPQECQDITDMILAGKTSEV